MSRGVEGAGSEFCLPWERQVVVRGCGQTHEWVTWAFEIMVRAARAHSQLGRGWGCFPEAPVPGFLLGQEGQPPEQAHGCVQQGREQVSRDTRGPPSGRAGSRGLRGVQLRAPGDHRALTSVPTVVL